MAIQIFLFDHFRFICQDRDVSHFSSSKAETLIAYVALHADNPIKRHYLAFQLWPDSDEAQALANLRKLMFILRQDLPEINSLFTIDHETIQLAESVQSDVAEFRRHLGQAEVALKKGDVLAAVQSLERATQIYRGDLLRDCYDEWVIVEREPLAQAYLKALARLAELHENLPNPEKAISTLRLLLARDPLQEWACRKLMQLYILTNDRVAALRTYHTCASALRRELGIGPSERTQRLYSELLSQVESSCPPEQEHFRQPLVGRAAELETLQRSWRQVVQTRRASLVLIAGDTGIGKTHLAEAMLYGLRSQGVAVCNSRCYPAEGTLSFSPLLEWMRVKVLDHLKPKARLEIGRILPEIGADEAQPPSPVSETERRQALFEAIAAALNTPDEAQLLSLDDLQYCDRDTLEWLHYFLRAEIQTRTLVIATCRQDEIGAAHPLLSMLYSLRRLQGRLVEVVLKPLSRDETRQLAAQMAPEPLPEPFLSELYQTTEGNPLFVSESMRTYLSEGTRSPDRAWRFPPKVKMVIEARLGQLSRPAQQMAGAAAVLGGDIDVGLLQTVAGVPESEFLDALDELWMRGVLRDEAGGRYLFSHNLIRESAYQSVNPARRQWLHRQVAAALEVRYPNHPNLMDGWIAAHSEAGGNITQASQAYALAGDYSMSTSSSGEAIRLYNKSISLNSQGGAAVDRRLMLQTQERLGDALQLNARYDEARAAFKAAFEAADEQDEVAHLRLKLKSGNLLGIQYRYEEAQPELDEIENTISRGKNWLDTAQKQLWIQLELSRMWVNFVANRPAEMEEQSSRLRGLVEQYGTPYQQGLLFEALVYTAFRRDRYVLHTQEPQLWAQAAIDVMKNAGSQSDLAFAIFLKGFTCMWTGWRGEFEPAEAGLKEAARLSEQIGDRLTDARALTYLLTLYRKYQRREAFEDTLTPARVAADEMRRLGEFPGVVDANLAWYAHSKGDFEQCLEYHASALKRSYLFTARRFFPFYWLGHFPALAVKLEQGDYATGATYVQDMLQPGQQLLHPQVATPLEEARAAWPNQDGTQFANCLRTAVDQAHEWGYL